MTADLGIAPLRENAEAVVRNVFETMLGLAIGPAAEVHASFEAPLTAAVYYVGVWKGALVLECSTRQAVKWAEFLMSLAPPASLQDARDGLAELANMIAGNLKPLLTPGVSLSIPSVVEGMDHKLRILGDVHREVLGFEDDGAGFRVSLVMASGDSAAEG